MKNLKKLFHIAFPIVSLFVVLFLIFKFEQLDNIIVAFKSLDPIFIAFCLLIVVLSWLIEAYILFDISDRQLSFRHSVYIVLAGLFFNAITPFSSGGQPMQLYMMHKYRISVGKGSSILARKFLIFQTITVLYGLMVVLFEASYFMAQVPTFVYFGIVGFFVNFLVIAALFFVSFRYKEARRFFACLAIKIRKISKSKKIRRTSTGFLKGVREFYTQMRQSVNGTNWFKLGVLTFVQLSLFYSVPVMIALGLDLSKVQFIRMISASAFVSMVTAFIPLPGAAFGAEGGFYVFFEMFFPNNTVLMALIMWRLLTFYIPLIVGFFVVIFLKYRGMGISLEQKMPNSADDCSAIKSVTRNPEEYEKHENAKGREKTEI